MLARFLALCTLTISLAGCVSPPQLPVVENPLVIPYDEREYVWQQTVEVLDEYFEISAENRIEGRIETYPKVASTLLEPWQKDSVDQRDRLEATLQSKRKWAVVHVTPAGQGHAVQIEVHTELEDLPRPIRASAGDALFNNDVSVSRQERLVGVVPASEGWIYTGRDWKLESTILNDLQTRFGLVEIR